MPYRSIKLILARAAAATALCLNFTTGVWAGEEESPEAKIARALTAAPSTITGNATILDVDGTVLRKGTNGWTCSPGFGLGAREPHPMCNDAVWQVFFKARAAGEVFSTKVVGFSYMLAGDMLVNNDNPAATDPDDGGVWVQEGPHVMLLMPTIDMMADLPRDPFAGGPYVMFDNTPVAHVMVPVPAKPE